MQLLPSPHLHAAKLKHAQNPLFLRLFLTMCHSCWMSALLSAAPTVASATLLTQYTHYFRPIPTVLPSTFTNPLLPLHPKHHNSTSINAMNSLASELCTPPSTGALTRLWRYNVYDIGGTPALIPSPLDTCTPDGSWVS